MGDRYRSDRGFDRDHASGHASGGRRYDDRPPPPPPPSYGYSNYPPPPGLAYDDPYSYRPNSSHGRSGDHYAPRSGPGDMPQFGQAQNFSDRGFDFKTNHSHPPPQYPPQGNRQNGARRDYEDTASRRRDRRAQRGGNRGGHRSNQRKGASERELLRNMPRESTPPQLEGMNEGKVGVKYAELLSSDDDEDDGPEEAAETEPPKPKWSNAELYTALPPPDTSQRKQKDMVKLIRKARVESVQENGSAPDNALATNDDFISLAFGDEEEEEFIKPAPANAPKGPAADRSNGLTIKGIANKAVDSRTEYSNIRSATVQAARVDNAGAKLTSLSLKRKRADNDEDDLELRELRPPSKSLKRPAIPDGKVLREWTMQGDVSQLAVPWLRPTGPHRIAANARLHQEVVDFYKFVGPKRYEHAVREDLLVRLSRFMDKWHIGAQVRIFGSYAAGLYLPDADMDVAVLSPQYRSRGLQVLGASTNQLRKLATHLQRSGFAETTEVIAFARVPIVKFVDRLTSIKVDMSFENETGIVANATFVRWKAQFPAMPILVMVIKQFLLMRGLNDVSVGGIGGFSITCLVTSLMQHMPRVQTGELDPMRNLGETLIEFLDFYGNRINYERVALRMDPPGFPKKQELRTSGQIRKGEPERLMIIDPNQDDNDISGGSRLAWMIFDAFATAKDAIMSAMDTYNKAPDASRVSVLGCILAGNYNSFLWYRRHLRRVHEDIWGPVDQADN